MMSLPAAPQVPQPDAPAAPDKVAQFIYLPIGQPLRGLNGRAANRTGHGRTAAARRPVVTVVTVMRRTRDVANAKWAVRIASRVQCSDAIIASVSGRRV